MILYSDHKKRPFEFREKINSRMGRYVRKRKGSSDPAAAAGRKRKIVSARESEISTTSSLQFKTRRRLVAKAPEIPDSPASSGCESVSSGNDLESSRSSHELAKESPNFADLKDNAVNVECTATSDSKDRIEKTQTREVQPESGELESTAMPRQSNHGSRSTAEKMPTETELEEFFAAAEKNLQKQFTDKYNYDTVKDEPLEGPYEWVPLHDELLNP